MSVSGPRSVVHGPDVASVDAITQLPIWTVALSAVFDGDALSSGAADLAQRTALEERVLITFEPERCRVRFQVVAHDMALATRAAMARWAHVTEVAQLPWWQVERIVIDRVAFHDGAHVGGDLAPRLAVAGPRGVQRNREARARLANR